MITKSIRISNIKNLTVIIKGNKKFRPIKKEIIKPVKNIKTNTTYKRINKKTLCGEAIACDDKLIQKIIKNGGL
jgi:hypothetical protein